MASLAFRTRRTLTPLVCAWSCAFVACTAAASGGETAPWFVPPSSDLPRSVEPAPGLIERSLASPYGVGVISTRVDDDDGILRIARLDVTWITTVCGDTLRLGDNVNPAGTWGRSMRFGGVQYGTHLRAAPSVPTAAPPASLLAPGFVDRAFAAGFMRRNDGLADDGYGPLFASAILRRGLFENVTAELRGNAQQGLRNGGAALHIRMADLGALTAATAVSRSDVGVGRLAQTGFEYQGMGFNVAIGSQWTTARYRQLGLGEESVAPRHWSTAQASVDLAQYGALGLGYSALARYDTALTRIVQGNYMIAIGRFSWASVSFAHTLAPESYTSVMLTLSFPIDVTVRNAGVPSRNGNPMQFLDRTWTAFGHWPFGKR